MSPYVFVLLMELFNQIMMKSVRPGKCLLHHKCSDPQITHLSFADDLIAFMHGDSQPARGFRGNLEVLRDCTGLQVNLDKSLVFSSGIGQDEWVKMNIIQFPVGVLPIKYLGCL